LNPKTEGDPVRAIVAVLVVLTVFAAISVFDFSAIVTPIAKATILFVPAAFMVSLVIGFASRKGSWFR
jgi:hypothetical protein